MKPKLKLITAMLIFGSIGLFVRFIDLPAAVVALIRGAAGTLCLAGAGILMKNRISFRAIRKNLLLLIVSGTAIGLNWIFLFEAYRYTTIAAATLCYYLAPVFVVIVSPILLKEKLSPARFACIAAALGGMVLVADLSGGGSGSNQELGIGFGLLAALFYASIVIMNKFLKDISAIELTMAQLFTASAVLLPYVLITEEIGALASVGPGRLICLLIVGTVHTGLGYLLYFSSVRELKGQTVALFSYIDPVTAIVLSSVLLNEKMNGLQAAGAALILGATLAGERLGGKHKNTDTV